MKKSAAKVFLIGTMLLALGGQVLAQEAEGDTSSDASAWRFAAGLSWHIGSKLKFHDVNRTGIAGNAGADVDLNNAASLDLDLRHVTEDAWGLIVGLNMHTAREITGGEFTGSAWGIPYSANGDRIRVSTLAGSAVYRWTYFYIPFGFNISRVDYEKSSGNTGSYDERGGIGAQFGLGWYVSDNAVIEVMSQSVSVNLEHTSGGVTTDFRRGYLSSLSVGAKYLF